MIRKARLQAQVAGALGAALMIAACNPSATDDAATAPATADRQALWANALRDGSLAGLPPLPDRSEEHTSELQSLMRISYAVFCLQKTQPHTHPSNAAHHSYTNTLLLHI